MKRLICILLVSVGIVYAEENHAKIVYDLVTKDVSSFELRVLNATVANKAYYESTLRELDISAVIHGGAYRFFVKNPALSEYKNDKALMDSYKDLAKRIKTLATIYDVEFLVCGSGLRKHGLEKKDLYDFVQIIPNATIGLTDKQNEGYAYIPVGD